MAVAADILPRFRDARESLRHAFAKLLSEHPELLERLAAGGASVADPDEWLLLEAMALLIARTERKFDRAWPDFVDTALNVLSPGHADSIPSFALLQADAGALRETVLLPRGTRLELAAPRGPKLTFCSCSDLWAAPVIVSRAGWVARSGLPPEADAADAAGAIRLRLEAAPADAALAFDGARPLRFSLCGDAALIAAVQTALFRAPCRVVVTGAEAAEPRPCRVQPLGFVDADALLPPRSHQTRGERLMREYFLFPQKFLGFELFLPEISAPALDVWMLLPQAPAGHERIRADLFVPNTVPAVNLFEDTVQVEAREEQSVHPVAVAAPPGTLVEVHSVVEVRRHDHERNEEVRIPFLHEPTAFYGVPVAPERCDVVRRGVELSLMLSHRPTSRRGERLLHLRVRCANGDQPALAGAGLRWQSGDGEVMGRCLAPPTSALRRPLHGETPRPAQQLLADALAVWEPERGSELLRGLLAPVACHDWEMSEALRRRRADRHWVAGVLSALEHVATIHERQGRHVEVRFDGDCPGGPLLFGTILANYLAQFRRCNTFSTLVLHHGTEAYPCQP